MRDGTKEEQCGRGSILVVEGLSRPQLVWNCWESREALGHSWSGMAEWTLDYPSLGIQGADSLQVTDRGEAKAFRVSGLHAVG